MRRLALTLSAIAGLVLGAVIGAGLGTAFDGTNDSPVAASEPRRSSTATWTYSGQVADLELPLDYELVRDDVETDFGYQSDFASTEGSLIIETAPRFADSALTLSEIADRFAETKGGTVERRRIDDVAVYAVSWTELDQPTSQYFFTKDDMTYGFRSDVGTLSDQTNLLDQLLKSVSRNDEPAAAATPTAPPTPAPTAAAAPPTDCVGDDQVPLAITNVKKYANARDRASPDAAIVERVPLGTVVTWTGEKLKNGRFTWHEIYYPDIDRCVWVAHTLLEESAFVEPDPPTPSGPVVLSASEIAGDPIGGSSKDTIEHLVELIGEPAGPFSTFQDSFWGPFKVGCFTFLSWQAFDVVTCDDDTTAGWIARTDAPAEIKLDGDRELAVSNWRTLRNWPDDTTAYFRIDVERWVISSKSLGFTGIAQEDTERTIETDGAADADKVLPSSTIITEVWNLDPYG